MEFSFKWFFNKKKEELLSLQVEEQKIKNDLLTQQVRNNVSRPYRKIKFVDNILTVVLDDGSVINKSSATVEDFKNVRESLSEAEVIDAMKEKVSNKEEATTEEIVYEKAVDGISLLAKFPNEFEIKDGSVYLKGISRSLPPLLVAKFAEIAQWYYVQSVYDIYDDEEFISLKKFWMKCCLNPNWQSAEDLYTFLTHHNMKIDRHGNFYAYRRVMKVKEKGNNELVDAISNAYNKVKAVWKKKPSDYTLYVEDGKYQITNKFMSYTDYGYIGELEELYLNLPCIEENRYTDAHTRKMDYRVGEIASIPRNMCDDNNRINCSKGLHAASKAYDYSGFGDTPILMIINPMDAVAVPHGEVGKLRVSRWFFAMTLDENEKYILDEDDFDVTELGDIFEEKCLYNLEEHAHQSFTEEVKRHTFTIPQMSNIQIKSIVNMIEDMSDVIKDRVVRKK